MINFTKEQIDRDLQRYRRKRLVFLILAIICFALWVAADIVTLNLYYNEIISDQFYFLLSLGSQLIGIVGVLLIFLRTFIYGRKVKILQAISKGQDVYIGQSDGSAIKYTSMVKEEQSAPSNIDPQKANLIAQYEDLMKQGVISKEDFEKRKEEILK